jgi:hypothetical protein
VEISKVMAALKSIAMKQSYEAKEPSGPAWCSTFLDVLQHHGRVFELELMLKFNLKKTKNPVEVARCLLKDVPMGIEMFKKGKLLLKPDRIKHRDHIRIIYENVRKMGSEK